MVLRTGSVEAFVGAARRCGLYGYLVQSTRSGASILFVGDMDDAAFDAGNQSVVDRLETLGRRVEMADDNDATVVDPRGKGSDRHLVVQCFGEHPGIFYGQADSNYQLGVGTLG